MQKEGGSETWHDIEETEHFSEESLLCKSCTWSLKSSSGPMCTPGYIAVVTFPSS